MQRTIIALLALAILARGGVADGLAGEATDPVITGAIPSPASVTDEDTLTIAFTGATLIHDNVSAAARRNGSPFDFRPMFAGVRHLIAEPISPSAIWKCRSHRQTAT